jgi:carbon storage regulator CsrA
MLVLARRLHERIIIPSIRTAVEVTAVKQNFVRLGIEAPPEVTVLREEIYRRSAAEVMDALPVSAGAEARLALANQVWRHRLNNLTLGLALLRQQMSREAPPEALSTLRVLEGETQELCEQLRMLCDPTPLPAGAAGGCPSLGAARPA